jgi:hypothetical protein
MHGCSELSFVLMPSKEVAFTFTLVSLLARDWTVHTATLYQIV